MTPGFVVANPGSIPEMLHMANALAQTGVLRAYVAPFSPTPSEIADFRRAHPGPIGRRAADELRHRCVIEDVGRSQRLRAARAHNMAMVAASRLGLPLWMGRSLTALRDRAFQSVAAHALQAEDAGLVVPSGVALAPLERARRIGVCSWLEYGIAHHRYTSRLLAEEARLQPDFAPSLASWAISPARDRQLGQEIALADNLIVLSSFESRTFIEEGVAPERLHVLPLGVDTELFRPATRTRSETLTIGFVGQMTQRKGLSYLVAAFQALRPGSARLLMVGRQVGPSSPWMVEGAEHYSAMPRWELPQFYAQMDVFVFPSLIEGFGLTALEAMACGVPVIVSENTFGTDIVADGYNGYVVPIRDVDAIVQRIRLLADDEALRTAMGRNARATAETFTWGDAFSRRLLDLLASS